MSVLYFVAGIAAGIAFAAAWRIKSEPSEFKIKLAKKIADRRAELEGIQEKNAESFAAELQNAKTREDVKQILTDAEAFVSRGILSAEKLVEIQHAADELVEEKKL